MTPPGWWYQNSHPGLSGIWACTLSTSINFHYRLFRELTWKKKKIISIKTPSPKDILITLYTVAAQGMLTVQESQWHKAYPKLSLKISVSTLQKSWAPATLTATSGVTKQKKHISRKSSSLSCLSKKRSSFSTLQVFPSCPDPMSFKTVPESLCDSQT